MRQVALTTTDNPYNPITQFDDWNAFDTQKGYNTCAYIARIVQTKTSKNSTIEEENLLVEDSIDEIIKFNVLGLYKKIVIDT